MARVSLGTVVELELLGADGAHELQQREHVVRRPPRGRHRSCARRDNCACAQCSTKQELIQVEFSCFGRQKISQTPQQSCFETYASAKSKTRSL